MLVSIIAAEREQIFSLAIKLRLAWQLALQIGSILETFILGNAFLNAKTMSLEIKLPIGNVELPVQIISLQIMKPPCVSNTVPRLSHSIMKMRRLSLRDVWKSAQMVVLPTTLIKLVFRMLEMSPNALVLTSETLYPSNVLHYARSGPMPILHQRNVLNFVLGLSMQKMKQGHARQHAQINTLPLTKIKMTKDVFNFVLGDNLQITSPIYALPNAVLIQFTMEIQIICSVYHNVPQQIIVLEIL